MSINSLYPASDNQIKAMELLKSEATNVLLYGGSRSGKSAIILEKQIIRAITFPGSRHLAARLNYNHARTSLFLDTLLKALRRYPTNLYTVNLSDCCVKFYNGSELWIGGLDSQERVEKLLGHEYTDIFFDEISQIDYSTVTLGLTRLAQNIKGCINRAYFACNPPSPLHWSYKLFVEKVDPKTGKPLLRPELYACQRLNPSDNLKNLPKDYIRNFLETLPDRDKKRFLYGEWCKAEGAIYDMFDTELMWIDLEQLPKMDYFVVGCDNTGNNLASILLGFAGDTVYALDEHTAFRQTMHQFNADMCHKWAQYNYIGYADPASGALIQELSNFFPADNAIQPGINLIQTKMITGKFKVLKINGVLQCPSLLSSLTNYRYDDKGRILKESDHECDALRYGIYTHSLYGGSILE
jgi:PBSX family phage terminase large subunit